VDVPRSEGFPPAPWQLSGSCVAAIRLVDVESARAFVPGALRIVPVLPGKTLGVLYCASYEEPSDLCYHELAIAPALTFSRGRLGFWISHLYVDEPASVEGGLRIWALPKKLAAFEWEPGRGFLRVSEGSRRLCSISWEPRAAHVRVPLWLPVISLRTAQSQHFTATGSCGFGRGPARIELTDAFSALGFPRSTTLVQAKSLRLRVHRPR
jgi:acetoacetate decarboxylase